MGERAASSKDDPYNLTRFVEQHKGYYDGAIKELEAGHKSSCWSWYLLPTPPFIRNGVEVGSGTNRMYALRTDEEARAYLAFEHPTVNPRRNYLEIMRVTATQLGKGVSKTRLLGIDVPRLEASVSYFERMSRGDEELHSACCAVMDKLELKRPDAASPQE